MTDGVSEDLGSGPAVDEEDPEESTVAEVSDVEDPDADGVDADPARAEEALRYFGADFDVDGLVRRLENGTFIVPTFEPLAEAETEGYEGFQRGLVWKKKQMDRFVESVLLGYPVPGIFLVELPSRRYLVLDGQQRMTTLHSFRHGKYPVKGGVRKFSLRYVGDDYKNLTYVDLPSELRLLFDNTFIQATIVVPQGEAGKKAVYALFERINSGGTNLRPQQIRVALFAGEAVNFVRELNSNADWRVLFGPHTRDLKDHELILRALSLLETVRGSKTFRPPMAKFLNEYLSAYSDALPADAGEISSEFAEACRLLREANPGALKLGGRQVNAAHTDAVLVGLMTAIGEGVSLDAAKVGNALDSLVNSSKYRLAVSESTSHADQVRARIRYSVAAFEGDSVADES
ncbi:DUF262 domain-containing protein [Streptomyces sp. AC04842]|uniref:GmrSD restriction endonuclease domain-containing protein n=1 Tax=Streptomyces sp. AC04842 TaxID=2775327 RepID=UPI0020C66262|nr:DUF262 domain-containing protein [Streptomyces sp. AC04842]